jgi:hypothetical protein
VCACMWVLLSVSLARPHASSIAHARASDDQPTLTRSGMLAPCVCLVHVHTQHVLSIRSHVCVCVCVQLCVCMCMFEYAFDTRTCILYCTCTCERRSAHAEPVRYARALCLSLPLALKACVELPISCVWICGYSWDIHVTHECV